MEQRRNTKGGGGDHRENPPNSGIVRHDFHMQICGSDTARNQTRFASVEGEISGGYPVLCGEIAKKTRQPATTVWHDSHVLRSGSELAGNRSIANRWYTAWPHLDHRYGLWKRGKRDDRLLRFLSDDPRNNDCLVRLDYSPPTWSNRARFQAGSFLSFSRVGIVSDEVADGRNFSGISRFPVPLNFRRWRHTHLDSPSSVLETSIHSHNLVKHSRANVCCGSSATLYRRALETFHIRLMNANHDHVSIPFSFTLTTRVLQDGQSRCLFRATCVVLHRNVDHVLSSENCAVACAARGIPRILGPELKRKISGLRGNCACIASCETCLRNGLFGSSHLARCKR
ncbi:hypothetical protein PR048_019116 [Dryococelus australis]|uniref:Uncharacterized protein n=1 Tax=Dryococelus australis TaxID=614101 RepID=A0ABQ9H2N1_9NEOP|nr:hypothetical protein PR048_019116 [Dryococelus australis]